MADNTLPAPLALQMSVASVTFSHQTILDHNRAIVAYELFDRSPHADGHTAASDAQLLFNVLSVMNGQSPIGNKSVFINCAHESLAGDHLDLVAPERVVMEIPSLAVSDVGAIVSQARYRDQDATGRTHPATHRAGGQKVRRVSLPQRRALDA